MATPPTSNGRFIEAAKTTIAIVGFLIAISGVAYSAGVQGAQIEELRAKVEKLETKAETVARLEERINAALSILRDMRDRN